MAFCLRSGREGFTAPATTQTIYHHFHFFPTLQSTNHLRKTECRVKIKVLSWILLSISIKT
jgi:hypothetical protein